MRRPVAAFLLVASATVVVVTLLVVWPSSHVARVRAVGVLDPTTTAASPLADPDPPTSVAVSAPTSVAVSAPTRVAVSAPTSVAVSAPTSVAVSAPPTTIAPAVVGDPVAVSIPTIGVTAAVVPVGVEAATNEIEVPPLSEVGWYRFGARPGEMGSSALVGHVDGDGNTGVFWKLRDLQPGDPVQVRDATGATRVFVVSARAEVAKSSLPADLFSRQGPTRLVLITCGGAFDSATHHYVDNVVVVATPQS